MAYTPDGGPAFPQGVSSHDGGATCSYDFADGSGMSLRDYFAAQAPVWEGLAEEAAKMANCDTRSGEMVGDGTARRLAEWAYRYADAMLRARVQPEPQSPRERQDAHLSQWAEGHGK